jgi:kynureninase
MRIMTDVDFGSGSSYGLTDGGPGGMIYTYIGGIAGFSTVVLSMAEMASM